MRDILFANRICKKPVKTEPPWEQHFFRNRQVYTG